MSKRPHTNGDSQPKPWAHVEILHPVAESAHSSQLNVPRDYTKSINHCGLQFQCREYFQLPPNLQRIMKKAFEEILCRMKILNSTVVFVAPHSFNPWCCYSWPTVSRSCDKHRATSMQQSNSRSPSQTSFQLLGRCPSNSSFPSRSVNSERDLGHENGHGGSYACVLCLSRRKVPVSLTDADCVIYILNPG